jgi:hypothetical protein
LQAPAKNDQLLEIFIPEFGLLNNRQLDFNRQHHGRLYRLSNEAMKVVSEALGFNANFELPTLRTAFVDICKGEGRVICEMDRNTKPTDINVRFSRDRWSQETGRADGLRPWIKNEYRSRFIEPRFIAQIAEALRLRPDDMAKVFVRVNFRERIYGVIGDERFAEQMPTGSFSWFSVPGNSVPAVAAEEVINEEDIPLPVFTTNSDDQQQDDWNMGEYAMTEQTDLTNSIQTAEQNADAAENTVVTDPVAASSVVESAEQAAPAEPIVAEAASPVAAPGTEVNAVTEQQPAESQAPARPVSQAVPLAVAAAQVRTPKKSSRDFATLEPSAVPQPAKQRTPERVSYSGSNFSQGQAKYDTYSKSEVDYMFKQQAESILSALSGKVAAQQRAFQEAIASQEKAFSRISNDFLAQLDATRVKLETTAKQTHEGTKSELDAFHTQLQKELDAYRTQINKVVVPVSKALEINKNVGTSGQKDGGKQGNVPPKVQQALQASTAKMQQMVTFVLLLSVASSVLSLITLITVMSHH